MENNNLKLQKSPDLTPDSEEDQLVRALDSYTLFQDHHDNKVIEILGGKDRAECEKLARNLTSYYEDAPFEQVLKSTLSSKDSREFADIVLASFADPPLEVHARYSFAVTQQGATDIRTANTDVLLAVLCSLSAPADLDKFRRELKRVHRIERARDIAGLRHTAGIIDKLLYARRGTPTSERRSVEDDVELLGSAAGEDRYGLRAKVTATVDDTDDEDFTKDILMKKFEMLNMATPQSNTQQQVTGTRLNSLSAIKKTKPFLKPKVSIIDPKNVEVHDGDSASAVAASSVFCNLLCYRPISHLREVFVNFGIEALINDIKSSGVDDDIAKCYIDIVDYIAIGSIHNNFLSLMDNDDRNNHTKRKLNSLPMAYALILGISLGVNLNKLQSFYSSLPFGDWIQNIFPYDYNTCAFLQMRVQDKQPLSDMFEYQDSTDPETDEQEPIALEESDWRYEVFLRLMNDSNRPFIYNGTEILRLLSSMSQPDRARLFETYQREYRPYKNQQPLTSEFWMERFDGAERDALLMLCEPVTFLALNLQDLMRTCAKYDQRKLLIETLWMLSNADRRDLQALYTTHHRSDLSQDLTDMTKGPSGKNKLLEEIVYLLLALLSNSIAPTTAATSATNVYQSLWKCNKDNMDEIKRQLYSLSFKQFRGMGNFYKGAVKGYRKPLHYRPLTAWIDGILQIDLERHRFLQQLGGLGSLAELRSAIYAAVVHKDIGHRNVKASCYQALGTLDGENFYKDGLENIEKGIKGNPCLKGTRLDVLSILIHERVKIKRNEDAAILQEDGVIGSGTLVVTNDKGLLDYEKKMVADLLTIDCHQCLSEVRELPPPEIVPKDMEPGQLREKYRAMVQRKAQYVILDKSADSNRITGVLQSWGLGSHRIILVNGGETQTLKLIMKTITILRNEGMNVACLLTNTKYNMIDLMNVGVPVIALFPDVHDNFRMNNEYLVNGFYHGHNMCGMPGRDYYSHYLLSSESLSDIIPKLSCCPLTEKVFLYSPNTSGYSPAFLKNKSVILETTKGDTFNNKVAIDATEQKSAIDTTCAPKFIWGNPSELVFDSPDRQIRILELTYPPALVDYDSEMSEFLDRINKQPKYQSDLTVIPILEDTMASLDLALLILDHHRSLSINSCLGDSLSKNVGALLPFPKTCGKNFVQKYFISNDETSLLPLSIAACLPQYTNVVCFRVNHNNTGSDIIGRLYNMMERIYAEEKDTIFIIFDASNGISQFAKNGTMVSLDKRNMWYEISRRTLAVVKPEHYPEFSEVSRAHVSSACENCHIGTYVVAGTFGGDLDAVLQNSMLSQRVDIVFSKAQPELYVYRKTNTWSSLKCTEHYKVELHPDSQYMTFQVVLAALRSTYLNFAEATTNLVRFKEFNVHSLEDINFEFSLLMKLNNHMIKASVEYARSKQYEAGESYSWQTMVCALTKQLMMANHRLKSTEIRRKVADVLLDYVDALTKESAKQFLIHPTAHVPVAAAQREPLLDDGARQVKAFLENMLSGRVENGLCQLCLLLIHCGRTTEIRQYLPSCIDRSLISVLLYAVGVCKHEVKQKMTGSTSYRNTEDHKRLAAFADEMECLASDIISKTHDQDSSLSNLILFSMNDADWLNYTPFDLARLSEASDFLSQNACADAINYHWWKQLAKYTWPQLLFPCSLIRCRSTSGCGRSNKVEPLHQPSERCTSLYSDKFTSGMSDIGDQDSDDAIPAQNERFYKIPAIKCTVHMASFIMFLLLYSYMILTGIGSSIDIVEYVILGWVFSFMIEEVVQYRQKVTLLRERSAGLKSITRYFSEFWNVVDFTSITLYFLAFIIRVVAHFLGNSTVLSVAHFLLAIDGFIFFLRCLQFFTMSRSIAVYFIIIRFMTVDLVKFMIIILVILVGYGVALRAVAFPYATLNWSLINDILRIPYLQIYGELGIEDIESAVSSSNATIATETQSLRNYLGLLLVGGYILFTNIMIINLLIAVFGSTYSDTLANAAHLYAREMADLLYEFQNKTIVPPPLCLLVHIVQGLKACAACMKKSRNDAPGVQVTSRLTALQSANLNNIIGKSVADMTAKREKVTQLQLQSHSPKHDDVEQIIKQAQRELNDQFSQKLSKLENLLLDAQKEKKLKKAAKRQKRSSKGTYKATH